MPVGGILLLGDTTMLPMKWELRLPPGHLELAKSLSQPAKKGVVVLARETDPHHRREIGLLLHDGDKEELI